MVSQTQLESPATRPLPRIHTVSDLKLQTDIQRLTPYRRALKTADMFRQRNSLRAFVAIFSNYVCIAACTLAVEAANLVPGTPKWLARSLYILCIIVIASRQRAFENLVHEASHNNLFSNKHLHERLEFLYAFPVFRILQSYRRSHMVHHKHLGDPEKDPDAIRIRELGLQNLPARPKWYLLGVPLTGFLTYEYFNTTMLDFWTTPERQISKTVYWAGVALALQYTQSFHLFAYYYLLPLLLILPITRYWAEASEHVGLDMTAPFGNSRSNIGFLHRWYLHPHNDGYHAVHHLQSQIPFHALPTAHRALMQASPEFEKRTVVSAGIVQTFRQMSVSETVMKEVSGQGRTANSRG